jgi:VanZ family protein
VLRLSRPLGSLLIALLLAALFTPSLPGQTYWQRVLQDAGHGTIFAGVAIVLLAMRRGAATGRRLRGDYTACFFVAVALGIATELLQHFLPHRQVSALDVLHDAAGAALGLAAIALVERRGGAFAEDRAGTAVAILLGAVVLLAWEPLRCARAYAERANAFPTLAPMGGVADAQFAGARNAVLSHASLPAIWAQVGEPAGLRLEFEAGARAALELTEAVPDWRGHSVLALDLTNPGPQAAHFILRVLDARHDWTHEDRLNLPVRIPARTRMTVRVALTAIEQAPVGRRMDLGDIANVMLFATAPLPGDVFYVSRIWLEE